MAKSSHTGTKMNLKLVSQSFEELQQLPFPKAVDTPDFTDWISELAELDAFYAGLAVSKLEGEEEKNPLLPPLGKLSEDLKKLHEQKGISEHLYEECERYLSALKNLADSLKE